MQMECELVTPLLVFSMMDYNNVRFTFWSWSMTVPIWRKVSVLGTCMGFVIS